MLRSTRKQRIKDDGGWIQAETADFKSWRETMPQRRGAWRSEAEGADRGREFPAESSSCSFESLTRQAVTATARDECHLERDARDGRH